MTTYAPIETRYAGCRFRSRLEARWAVFFDAMDIPWEYEPQGYTLSNGRNYLPDFLLPECGTWIEVKGSVAQLDMALMERAAADLPTIPSHTGCEQGPKMMILGPNPRPQPDGMDYGWLSYTSRTVSLPVLDFPCGPDDPLPRGLVQWKEEEVEYWGERYGFGYYYKNHRPWFLSCGGEDPVSPGLTDEGSDNSQKGYTAARSARFEWGEQGSGELPARHAVAELMSTPAGRGMLLALRPGDLVEHGKYGQGRVEIVSGVGEAAFSTINFGKYGRVKLMHNHAPMKMRES